MDQDDSGILLPIPLPDDRVFRNQAMDDILGLLYRNPHDEFGVRELREITGHGAQTVDTALDLFLQLAVVQTRSDGNQKLISINQNRLRKPDDPILEIPQEPFRTPTKRFLDSLQGEVDTLVGVILFGSVARGDADRVSDIDLFIVVDNDLMRARRIIQDLREELSNQSFEAGRYEFQVMIESVESAKQHGEKLQSIFSEGITLYETDQLDGLRGGVLHS